MNILFVCKGNRFRSKTAEAMFIKLNKNGKHKTKSAGIIKGRPVADIVKQCAKELGYTIKGSPRTIDIPLLKWQNRIIIVANDVPPSIFEGVYGMKEIVAWKIPDSISSDEKVITNIMKKIEGKVKNLIKELD